MNENDIKTAVIGALWTFEKTGYTNEELASEVVKLLDLDGSSPKSDASSHVPGLWMCPTCNYRLQKRIIGKHTVSDDPGIHILPCPNDGAVMEPVTWKEYSQGLELRLEQMLEEMKTLRELRSKPRIPREFHQFIRDYIESYEMRDQDHGDYTPNENERAVAEDAIHGLLDDDEFLSFVLEFRIGEGFQGVSAIAMERMRQIEKEGWTADHDDSHQCGEMATAAACYALTHARWIEGGATEIGDEMWPWDREWWKPSTDRVRDLEKAGALIAAEIDRLKRLDACKVCGTHGCREKRGPNFHDGKHFGSKECDYTKTPPFADAAWTGSNQDPDFPMCEWCAGTGHPHGDESYGMCKCPDLLPKA